MQIAAGAEIDQLQLSGMHVDQQVFILNVSVNDALGVASGDCLNNLAHQKSCCWLCQILFLGDKVEKIHRIGGSFHNIYQGVVEDEIVDKVDDPVNILKKRQKLQLHGNFILVDHTPILYSFLGYMFDGYGKIVCSPESGVHHAESAFAKNCANAVALHEGGFVTACRR